MARKVNDAALRLIRVFEGFEPVPYLCPANVATIGIGRAVTDPATGAQLVGPKGLAQARAMYPEPITEQQALDMLQADLVRYAGAVDTMIAVPTTDHAFGAMVSLAYNIGVGGFSRSSVLRWHNAKDGPRAADAFLMWNKSGGRELAGLTRRRAAERDLYLRED